MATSPKAWWPFSGKVWNELKLSFLTAASQILDQHSVFLSCTHHQADPLHFSWEALVLRLFMLGGVGVIEEELRHLTVWEGNACRDPQSGDRIALWPPGGTLRQRARPGVFARGFVPTFSWTGPDRRLVGHIPPWGGSSSRMGAWWGFFGRCNSGWTVREGWRTGCWGRLSWSITALDCWGAVTWWSVFVLYIHSFPLTGLSNSCSRMSKSWVDLTGSLILGFRGGRHDSPRILHFSAVKSSRCSPVYFTQKTVRELLLLDVLLFFQGFGFYFHRLDPNEGRRHSRGRPLARSDGDLRPFYRWNFWAARFFRAGRQRRVAKDLVSDVLIWSGCINAATALWNGCRRHKGLAQFWCRS